MKRFLVLILTVLILGTLVLSAAAKESTKAADMRLSAAEGTVTVKNSIFFKQKIRDGMRLYKGYTVRTAKESYAYFSLDRSKAVKLDANSSVKVKKSGKKLELSLKSGKLMFNVSSPLEKDESLNIRTSTMITGIRGTIGWVEVLDTDTSSVTLLEGSVQVTTIDDLTYTVSAGQTLIVTYYGATETDEERVVVTVKELNPEDIPGFVLKELFDDPDTRKRVEDGGFPGIADVIDDADKILDDDENEAEKELEDQKVPDEKKVNPLFGDHSNEKEYDLTFAAGINCDIAVDGKMTVGREQDAVFTVTMPEDMQVSLFAVPSTQANGEEEGPLMKVPVSEISRDGEKRTYKVENIREDMTILLLNEN